GQGVGFGTSAKQNQVEDNSKSIIENALKKAFAPEFLNRIDEVIVFNSLEKDDIRKIIHHGFEKVYRRVEDIGYQLSLTDNALDFISDKGYDKQYGARPLKRAIQKYIEDALAEEIVKGSLTENSRIILDYKNGNSELSIEINKADQQPTEDVK